MRPCECRGGILADEMGMGKSLTLLALIIHFLDEARSSARGYQEKISHVRRGRHWSKATLIVAPKSSTGPLQFSHSFYFLLTVLI